MFHGPSVRSLVWPVVNPSYSTLYLQHAHRRRSRRVAGVIAIGKDDIGDCSFTFLRVRALLSPYDNLSLYVRMDSGIVLLLVGLVALRAARMPVPNASRRRRKWRVSAEKGSDAAFAIMLAIVTVSIAVLDYGSLGLSSEAILLTESIIAVIALILSMILMRWRHRNDPTEVSSAELE